MESIQNLIDWTHSVAARGQYAYLLIDGAQHEDSHLWLERRNIHYVSLFDGTDQAALRGIAPLLVPLNECHDGMTQNVWKWALDLGARAPCLSWAECSLPLNQFIVHLGHFHSIGLNDRQVMLLRWYDTRVMPVWFACLSDSQRDIFTAGMFSLKFLDRFGNATLLFSTHVPKICFVGPSFGEQLLTLDDAQFAMLMNASELDTLIKHIRNVISDEVNLVSNKKLYEFVGNYQAIASTAGINDLDRQTQVVLLALYTSGKGIEHPLFQSVLKSPPSNIDAFHALIASLPDAVWMAGPPLWDFGMEKPVLPLKFDEYEN